MEILWLGHAGCHGVSRAGAKAALFSRLEAADRIPPGFCISAAAYAQWAGCTGDGPPALPTASIPPALYNALALAYHDLAAMGGVADLSVAVRSSAVDEDGPPSPSLASTRHP